MKFIIQKRMKNLKCALSKDTSNQRSGNSSASSSFRSKKSDASSSVWSVVAELEDEQVYGSIDNARFVAQFVETLIAFSHQVKPVNQETLSELINSQKHHFRPEAEEKDILHIMERKMVQVLEKAPKYLENYVKKFTGLIKQRKWEIKSKDLMTRKKVLEFDEIADKMFKKTTQIKKQPKRSYLELNMEKQKPKKRSAAKGSKNHDGTQNSNKSQDSAEGKLNKLLIADKYEKKQPKPEDNQQQSYSFSSMMSATVNIKQRSRNSKTDKKMDNTYQNPKVKDSKPTDEAFIFYRPKKGKKL